MDTVVVDAWTAERFLAWEDAQEGKHEFDGVRVVPTTGGTAAHQRIVFNLCLALMNAVAGRPLDVLHEMRLRIGDKVRYPDAVLCASPVDQTVRTLTDALVIFEVLSADTATTDRVDKLLDYAAVPSLQYYVLLEQTAVAATLFQRQSSGAWAASAHVSGVLPLATLGLSLALEDLYRGLIFAAPGSAPAG